MKANELRIGNKIMFSDDSSIFEVKGMHEFGLDVANDIEETYIEYDQFEPIPLTEELLLKCGFEEIKDYYDIGKSMFFYDIDKSLENCEFYIYYNTEDKNIYISSMENEESVSKKISSITSVHQLQNIFFALTNQELKIIL